MARSAPRGFWRGGSTSGVNKDFLSKVHTAVSAAGGSYVYIISGKRTPKTNTGVKNSNHLYGHALDGWAYIPGRGKVPLGTLLRENASQFGLRSGDVAGFYKGAPDPNHVDDGYNQGKPLTASAPVSTTTPPSTAPVMDTSAQTTLTPTTTDQSGANLDQQLHSGIQNIEQLPGAPQASAPLAGDQVDPTVIPQQVGDTWQLIASQGPVSPDTLRLASLASLGSNGPAY